MYLYPNKVGYKAFFLLFLFLLSFSEAFNQTNPLVFLNYLKQQNLHEELIDYTDTITPTNDNLRDSLIIYRAFAFKKMGLVNSYYTELLKLNEESAAYKSEYFPDKIILEALLKEPQNFLTSLEKTKPPISDSLFSILKLVNHIYHSHDTSLFNDYSYQLPYDLYIVKEKLSSHRIKSPQVATMLSTLLPGAGKFYLNKKYLAYSGFLTSFGLGAQFAENAIRANLISTRGILSGTLFGIFYFGNIIGTYALAVKSEKDFKVQIKTELTNFIYRSINLETEASDSKLKCDSCGFYEFNEFISEDKDYWKLKNAEALESKGFYKRAFNKLAEITDTSKSNLQQLNLWRVSLLIKNKDYKEANLLLKEISPVTDENINAEINFLKSQLYLQQNNYGELKSVLLHTKKIAVEDSIKITQLKESINYKDPEKAKLLSTIFPGAGIFYCGYPLKGFTSLVLHTALAGFATFQVINNYYITAFISGVLPLSKVYSGNRQFSEKLAHKKNNEREIRLSKSYQKWIDKLIVLPTR